MHVKKIWAMSVFALLAVTGLFAQSDKELLLDATVVFHNKPGKYKGQFNDVVCRAVVTRASDEKSSVTIVIDMPKSIWEKELFMMHNLQHPETVFAKRRVIIKKGSILHTEPEIRLDFKIYAPHAGSRGVIYITGDQAEFEPL